MKLVKFGVGTWTVYGICNARGDCQVLDMIAELETRRGNAVLSDLREYIPNSMPRDWHRQELSAALNGTDLLEFRWPTGKGGTPRILWFYDAGRVIVCAVGIDKKGSMGNEIIKTAERLRKEYLAAKAAHQLQVSDIESLLDDGEATTNEEKH